jgi:RNA-binding protein 39
LHFDNITQKSKGYCFVQYRKHVDAQQALDKMNGFEIAGRPIRVGLVTEKGSSNPNMQNSNGPNMGGGGGMGMSMGMNGPGSMQGGPGGPRPANSGMMRPDNLEDGGAPLPYRYTAKIT